MNLLALILLSVGLAQDPAPAEAAPTPHSQAVTAAEALIGEPYAWGGRNQPSHPGVDCLGLLYLAWGSVTGTSWRSYPVDPSKLVASGLLGQPVPGLDAVPRDKLDPASLQPGDVLYFLLQDYEIPDAPLWHHDDHDYWPWHTGLYAGEGRVLHAQPGGRVRSQRLDAVMFDALYVTRR